MIVSLAEEVARNRDNQEVSVDDLLTAVDRMPAETSAAQLLRGERKGVPDPMIRESLLQLSDNVGTHLRSLETQMRNLEQELRSTSALATLRYDLSDLKSEMSRQCGELDRKLGEVAARLVVRTETVPPAPPPAAENPQPPKSSAGIWDRLTSP